MYKNTKSSSIQIAKKLQNKISHLNSTQVYIIQPTVRCYNEQVKTEGFNYGSSKLIEIILTKERIL